MLNNNYKYVKNVIPSETLEIIKNYVILQSKVGKLVQDEQCPLSLSQYGDPLLDTMLAMLTPKLEKEAEEALLPTYSYYRLYSFGEVLEIHKDRPACEVSCTVSIAVDDITSISPLYVNNSKPKDENDGIPIIIQPGDGILYNGCDLYHWRKKIQNQWFIQVFFHYVRASGQYNNLIFDGRSNLGVPPNA